jgi:putative transposase
MLAIATKRFAGDLHAYVLMTNHVHLLITPLRRDSLSRILHYVAGTYSRGINERIGRTGAMWGSRFWSTPVEADEYCLACYRYIELNPVRAGMVTAPGDYRWSSYQTNACGMPSSLVVPHATYLALGRSADGRTLAYQTLFDATLSKSVVDDIRNGTRRGQPIGRVQFRERFERTEGH